MIGAKEIIEDQEWADFYNLGEWPSDQELRDDERAQMEFNADNEY